MLVTIITGNMPTLPPRVITRNPHRENGLEWVTCVRLENAMVRVTEFGFKCPDHSDTRTFIKDVKAAMSKKQLDMNKPPVEKKGRLADILEDIILSKINEEILKADKTETDADEKDETTDEAKQLLEQQALLMAEIEKLTAAKKMQELRDKNAELAAQVEQLKAEAAAAAKDDSKKDDSTK